MSSRAPAAVALGAAVALMIAFQQMAQADNSACPSPSPGSRSCVNQSQSGLDELSQRLGADVDDALALQQRLSTVLAMGSAQADDLAGQLSQEEARIAQLQDEIAQLDQQIQDLQSRIEVERGQVADLARALYRQPASFLDIIASSGNLADALTATADLVIAGQRAHALQQKLQADMAQVQADRDARQTDLDQENATLAQLQAGIELLSTYQARLDDLNAQLTDLVAQIQAAAASLGDRQSNVTAALASDLEQQLASISQQVDAVAWAEAGVGAGPATDLAQLPVGSGPYGLSLSWPLARGTITQLFGPTTFALEPPLGPYPHFHTGVDVAAPEGSPVLAAADGVVIAVKHTSSGYGNYVIIAHGSGVLTLYAHLLETDVVVGQLVVRTEMIGREGATGLATGPHVHFELRVNGGVIDPMLYLPPLPPL